MTIPNTFFTFTINKSQYFDEHSMKNMRWVKKRLVHGNSHYYACMKEVKGYFSGQS